MPEAKSDVGSFFGKYFLMKKLAAGGMGEIYLAKQQGPAGFQKILVVKKILAHLTENKEFIEAFLGDQWHTFDARHNVPRVGRVLMAHGRDAVDVALTTSFGPTRLAQFKVWTDEVLGDHTKGIFL